MTHVFNDLRSASLISLGQLCDNNCDVLLQKKFLHVFKNNKKILHGVRNFTDGLWDIYLKQQSTIPKLNVIIQKATTKKDLIHFFHGTCFSPTKATFLRAIKNGNFISWPGLTYEAVNKFLSNTIPTAFGHLQQGRQNLQSTKQTEFHDQDLTLKKLI